jgi:hypothetical protein
MAIDIHLVARTESEGDNNKRDGIEAVLIAIDDSVDTTAALVRARAATVLSAAGYDLPSDYFDANTEIATGVTSQALDTAGDYMLFGDYKELSEA